MANNTDNYIRLNFSSERELSDFQLNSSALSGSEISLLIEDKKTEILDKFTTETTKFKMYYNLYSFVPDWILEQLYYKICAMPKRGALKCFLNDSVFGSNMMVELMAGTLEAYNIRNYKEEILAGGTSTVIIQPKPLSRTTATQSLGDMSLSFESERLGIDISTPFEQYLSTLPNGIEILEFYKNCLQAQPTMGVV